jgi:hypothetical protein
MADTFKNVAEQDNPASRWFLVSPSDTVAFTIMPRGIYCSADGTAQMVDEAGTVMPVAMVAGTFVPFRPMRINTTSTTGTFYGLY